MADMDDILKKLTKEIRLASLLDRFFLSAVICFCTGYFGLGYVFLAVYLIFCL